MAMRMILEIKDLDGESKLTDHEDKIDVISWSWGISQDGTMHTGGGGGAGTVSVRDLSVTKYVDKATPSLHLACCDGTHFDEATLISRKMGKDPIDYLKIKMSPVMITGIESGGSDGEDRLMENITFNFAKVEVIYTPQKDDGSADAEITVNWNIEAGKKE